MSAITFNIEKGTTASGGRAGVLTTPHGTISTPAFVPVGTKASVKGILPDELKKLGTEVVLANTYHLYLQPGEDIVKDAGGLGAFMGWQGPTITDSGGFQVFSLGAAFDRKVSKLPSRESRSQKVLGSASPQPDHFVREVPAVYDEGVASQHGQLAIVDDEGVSFTSHLDGSLHRFTPERSIEIQHALGADIFFAFDECTAPTESYAYQKEAMERTHRWAERSLKTHRQNIGANKRQAIFGIAQGGQFDELRRESAQTIGEMGFDGFGLGGSFSRKYGDDSLESALAMLSLIPPELPVHGLGIGEPEDILAGIAAGVDLFDSVTPTRHGRHGSIYTKYGLIHLTNEKYKNDFTPLEADSLGVADTNGVRPLTGFTRAYLSHLLRSGEMLGATIASMHNVQFLLDLVRGARKALLNGTFADYRAEFLRTYYG